MWCGIDEKRGQHVCVLCVPACVSVCAHVSLCLCVHVCPCVFVSMCVCLYVANLSKSANLSPVIQKEEEEEEE